MTEQQQDSWLVRLVPAYTAILIEDIFIYKDKDAKAQDRNEKGRILKEYKT